MKKSKGGATKDESKNKKMDISSSSGSDSEEDLNMEAHKKSLDKLKSTDPDFYTFLEQNDKNLLNFDTGSEDDSADEESVDDKVHKPGPLEADSDESDFEDENTKPIKGKVTLKMVSDWQTELQAEGRVKLTTITTVIKVFNAAMLRVTSDDGTSEGEYKVEGSSVFNAVIQMCVLSLPNAIKKYLGSEQSGKDIQKCKHFVKIKSNLVSYLNDLLKLLGGVTSENILTVLLKHLHQMSIYVACFTRIAKQSLKRLIVFWSTGEETVRVLAFLCILRITRNQQTVLLNLVLKAMYMTYVKNSKFVSPSTWPGINFMRRSLVEMYTLDVKASYEHAFLYVRQLAIHLRNAMVVNTVENRQAVYNWQFINSMHLWSDLFAAAPEKSELNSLVYPLVTVIMSTIKLVPTHQYFPLRFHCLQMLIDLSKVSSVFVPLLPLLVEVLTYNFNKAHKKTSMKPLDFSCILRVSKSQVLENGFKDAVIERVYAQLLEYTASLSHYIAFSELVFLATLQLKQFLKTCSIANYTKKLRQLYDKIEENTRFIEQQRKAASFHLSDLKMVNAWQESVKTKGPPLLTFYENWSKINKLQRRKKVSKNDETAGAAEMPVIKRTRLADDVKHKLKQETKGPLELFPSDSEDETQHFNIDEPMEGPAPKKDTKSKKKQLKKRTTTKEVEDMDVDVSKADIIKEFKVTDW